MRNAARASQNDNCLQFDCSNTISPVIPFFHRNKNNSPLNESDDNNPETSLTLEEQLLISQLEQDNQSEFVSNILFYIGGFIVYKLVKVITCQSCLKCLISCSPSSTKWEHDYCGSVIRYDEVAAASAFTLFVNNGGLNIPSKSVFLVVEYAEKVFKACVCKAGRQIYNGRHLKTKMVVEVVRHFLQDKSENMLFQDHEGAANECLFEDDHRTKLIKYTADKYFSLRLFTYGKHYYENVVRNGQSSDRYKLTKLILFKNQ